MNGKRKKNGRGEEIVLCGKSQKDNISLKSERLKDFTNFRHAIIIVIFL
jgi:hypothetical protein